LLEEHRAFCIPENCALYQHKGPRTELPGVSADVGQNCRKRKRVITLNQSTNQQMKQSSKQSSNQSNYQSSNQAIKQSSNQASNQASNPSC
jgi:Sec-independent protein translocase protein TatA